MSKGLFVTGTGTDVGKTYVTGLLLKKLNEFSASTAYYKAAMSGNERDHHGNLLPGDALFVKNMAGLTQDTTSMCPYIYEQAVSPHLAAKLEGNPVRLSVVMDGFETLKSTFDYIVVEGSGGILCPIATKPEELWLEDIIYAMKLPSIIIADAGLGTINAVILTVSYMKQKNLPVKGIIFNHYHPGNIMEEDNLYMCEKMTNLPVIACVTDDCLDLKIELKQLIELFEEI